MKQQYQTRYEWLHESYQKWLTGFIRRRNDETGPDAGSRQR
ncbi:TPA: hypothetical protein ACWST1_003765 [Escherichia coli]|nr:hypothetical protein [Escherichia coli]